MYAPLVEKTELLSRLSAYALSKIDLDRYGSFRKILLTLSWDINLNLGQVHGIQNENLFHVLPFHDCIFCEDGFSYNLNSLSENVSRNKWNVFKKRGMHFIHINVNSLLPKIDEVRYIANITNASIIGISETKLDETIWSSELEVDGYDLVRLDRSRRGGGVACYIKSSIAYSYKDSFCSNTESTFVYIFCLNLSKSYWVSYIDHLINQISLSTLKMFSQKLGFLINKSVIS